MTIEFPWDLPLDEFEGFQDFHGHRPPHHSVKGPYTYKLDVKRRYSSLHSKLYTFSFTLCLD